MQTTFEAIAPGQVHRWSGAGLVVARRADLHQAPAPPLSPAEQRVLHGLPAWRRTEWVAGRLLAKRLVGEAVAVPASDVEILPRADGSPHVVVGGGAMPAVHVSISHTARHVAAALAPEPVGVDLCETDAAAAVRRAADHVLSPEERSLIGTDAGAVSPEERSLIGTDAGAAAVWALKEAAVKADRSGLFGSAPRRIVILGLRPAVLDGRRRAMVWQAPGAVLALVLASPRTDHRTFRMPS
ncbi:4'-phosphopantetheinyl transferase superfamily protein [Streptomyces sp. NPDC052676]|uniref:4'-phosphopantetheinyl transferase family protein n=1 Tax=Streptomyces sp. NPDC052676 TaxID=3154953 RepID=UPI00343D335E